jgi:2-(1,2-epoxy-1,2-dihydrophenyl)acetyl-CoA isomerase
MKYNSLKFKIIDQIAIIHLNRPDAMNAMNKEFFKEFQKILNDLTSAQPPYENIKCLLLTAEGKAFCSGADLKEGFDEFPPNLGKIVMDRYAPLILSIKNLPMPTLAAVNGAAVGAGMSLALSCDIIIAASSARFSQAFINIALIPDAGSSFFLPRLIGRANAAAMMMLGEIMTAEEAVNIGLIYKSFEDKVFAEEALKMAKKLQLSPKPALLRIRALLDASEKNDLEQQLTLEADYQQLSGKSSDFLEGVTAFIEKRSPKYK